MPLGIRRPLQITRETLTSENDSPLTKEDFEGEIGYSKVYDETTQLLITSLLTPLCKLGAILTDVIALAYPSEKPGVLRGMMSDKAILDAIVRSSECKEKLKAFYDEFVMLFPMPAGLGDTHPSLVLFINLVYIYY